MNQRSLEKCVLIAVLRSESQSQRKFKIFQKLIKGEKENSNLKIECIVEISRHLEKQNKENNFDKQQKDKKRPYHINKGIVSNKKDMIIKSYSFLFF